MKFALAALVLLATGSAMASPAVGDSITFAGTYQSSSGAQPITATISLIAYDSSTDEFTMRTETAWSGGAPQIKEEQIAAQNLPTDQQIQSYLLQCAAIGGTSEKLTVVAGTFDTCKLAQASENGTQSGFIWIADVPFATAKSTLQDTAGNGSVLEVVSFTRGQ